MNRREFLTGFTSCAVLAGTHVGSAGCTARPMGAPDLKFGVLSDVHLKVPGDVETLLKAFTYFRDNGADAVLIAGDITDGAYFDQLALCGDCWRKVFPGNKGLNGKHVEKLFIYGNHDVRNVDPKKSIPGVGVGVSWEKAFDEKYEPIWMKTVKGYTFIGAHWHTAGGAPAFLKAHAAELKGSKPFFYTQHAHPKDTCMCAWAWGHDDGKSTAALSEFPNAVAFSGHSHYTLTDERSVWQGAFTSINTASLRYASTDYSLRENLGWNGYGGEARTRAMSCMDTSNSRQGMLVSVYGSTLVIARREFLSGGSLGPDWRLSIPGGADQSFAARKARRSAPAFAAGAKPTVKIDDVNVTVSYPAAQTVNDCRVYEYEVTATLIEEGVDIVLAQRRLIAPDFHLPETPGGKPGFCVFRRSELRCLGHYVFSVRPIECFGRKGSEIVSDMVVLEKPKPKQPAPAAQKK